MDHYGVQISFLPSEGGVQRVRAEARGGDDGEAQPHMRRAALAAGRRQVHGGPAHAAHDDPARALGQLRDRRATPRNPRH